jgi:hypothetical protein
MHTDTVTQQTPHKKQTSTLPHAKQGQTQQGKRTQQARQAKQAKNNGQGFALVSDTKKQKNPALGRVSFSGFA